MKTQNLIGAVMMVSLSFTACQKEDVLAPRQLASSETQRLIGHEQVAKQFPLKVSDLVTGKSQEFFYDDSKRLTMIKDGGKNLEFAYDASGRLASVKKSQITDSRDGNSMLRMSYVGDTQKPASIAEIVSDGRIERIMNTTILKYDNHMNKISEQEVSADHTLLLSRLFSYDAAGNCIEYREMKNGLVTKHVQFADFDLHPSMSANNKVLALLPGSIFQKSNAQTVVELTSLRSPVDPKMEGVAEMVDMSALKLINNSDHQLIGSITTHFKFAYNSFNFPTEVIRIQSDFEETVQKIEYMANQW